MNIQGIELLRPWGLALWILPLLLLLYARRPGRPPRIATGTLEIWRAVAAVRPASAAGERPRIPPSVWLSALALALGALALAGPQAPRPAAPSEWLFVVDRSPSMFLPAAQGGTRTDAALARAAELAADWAARGDRILWSTGAGEVRAGALAPPELRLAPDSPRSEPDWSSLDRAGVVWVTDVAPAPARRHAGLIASGAEALPGPVAVIGATRLDWDGEALVEVPDGAPLLALRVDPRLPLELRELSAFYAESRGLELDGEGPLALAIEAVGEGPEVEVSAGREGFVLAGRAARSGVPASLGAFPEQFFPEQFFPEQLYPEPWLVTEGPTPLVLVAASPGRVIVALRALERIGGDPAALPVAFAALLDAFALPPPGIVALGERSGAGPARLEPAQLPAPSAARADDPPWIAALVLLAAACALAALGRFQR